MAKLMSSVLSVGIAFTIVSAFQGMAFAEGTSQPYGNGGPINAPAIVGQYNKSGERFKIEGYCRSSCTMLLAIRNVCVEPSATLAFHAAIYSPNQPIEPARNRQMASYYKPALRKYVEDNHFLDSWTFHTISGEELIHSFGYPECR